ncbi:hypothetical protein PFISCL1PPCAC_1412 [Pristionchus fissidentatus]|uniref:Uncharacterized protein n=1 Tax=Pristionchus fissidentatus TaxID=1538716 RepID=A0AAV5USI8_9BILA|nr:hypothetical protein PFISCL1PPCAC_1412 [Pristionchus fissidentatus]
MSTSSPLIVEDACKYLVVYPFSPLTASKSCALEDILQKLRIYYIKYFSFQSSSLVTLSPIFDLISIAVLLVSLWFTLQKFFWRKLEIGFNVFGFLLCLFTTFLLLLNHPASWSMYDNILYNHILLSLCWSFNVVWSTFHTMDTVSKLLIPGWGEATEEQEIEALEMHF